MRGIRVDTGCPFISEMGRRSRSQIVLRYHDDVRKLYLFVLKVIS